MRGTTDNTKMQSIRSWQNITGVAVLLLATAVTLIFLLQNIITTPPASSTISMTGVTVCLPHKDTSGPTTLECAIGLRGDDGRFYALSKLDPNMSATNELVEVKGTLKEPSSNEIYNIAGTIEVSSAKKQ